jgi:hypothetical protein
MNIFAFEFSLYECWKLKERHMLIEIIIGLLSTLYKNGIHNAWSVKV